MTEIQTKGGLQDRRTVNWSLLALARFVLATIVMNTHLHYFEASAVSDFISLFDGKAAVVGFLMISGYSVTSSLDRNADSFLFRRLTRIYPAYLFAIIASLALQLAIAPYEAHGISFTGSGPVEIIGNLLLLQMYAVKALNFDPVIWSLSIEFSYYVFMRLFGSIDPRILVGMMLASMLYFVLPFNLSDSRVYAMFMKLNMIRCLWPFLLGVFFWRYPSHLLKGFALVAGTGAMLLSEWTFMKLQFATYLFSVAMLVLAEKTAFKSRTMNLLGDVSYPLYLIHIPVGLFLAGLCGITHPAIIAGSALVVSALIFFLVEVPARKMIARLRAKARGDQTAALRVEDIPVAAETLRV